jgi:hypothetical protein
MSGSELPVSTGGGRRGRRICVLSFDIFEPDETPTAPRPAQIVAFGSAFERGARKDDVVGELPHRSTSKSEYCLEFRFGRVFGMQVTGADGSGKGQLY